MIHRFAVVQFFCVLLSFVAKAQQGNPESTGRALQRVGQVMPGRRTGPGSRAASEGSYVREAEGAIIRGDTTQKKIALVFTGDQFAEGFDEVSNALSAEGIHASFFLTGRFYTNPVLHPLIRRLIKNGHYLGAHSDQHLQYCDWTKRDSLLVNRAAFRRDLAANYKKMAAFGIRKKQALYFLPAYEWYNATINRWTTEMGLRLVNYSPGTLSAADYTWPEMGKRYRSSEEVYRSIMDFETRHLSGMNGFMLLIHAGTDPRRTDKFYTRLSLLIRELKARGYRFVRVDELLR